MDFRVGDRIVFVKTHELGTVVDLDYDREWMVCVNFDTADKSARFWVNTIEIKNHTDRVV